jgi:F-type H+-transporting ATPase subunit a
MMLVVGVTCVVLWLGTSNKGLIPTKLQVTVEKLFFFVGNIVKVNIGTREAEVFPYAVTLFLFLAVGNAMGLLPYAFSFTSQIVVTIGIAVAVFIASIIVGIRTQGTRYIRHFCPAGIPSYLVPFFVIIELMSFLFRPISLGVRLFANMVAGHIMIKVIAGFAVSISSVAVLTPLAAVPIAFDVLLNIFKLAVCGLQAYVFVILSCMYLAESLETASH